MTTIANYGVLTTYVYTPGNESVFLLGYYSTGDGGEGLFNWDTSGSHSADGGTVVGSGSGKWVRQYEGAMNARWFGAKGDGIADDRITLTSAITAAKLANKSLFIPAGTYSIQTVQAGTTTSIQVNGSSAVDGLELLGETGTKITSSVTPADGSGNTLLRFQDQFMNVKIMNIEFESTHGLTTGSTHCIGHNGNGTRTGTQIIDCSFTGFSQALFINGSEQLVVNRCKFYSPLGHNNAQTNRSPAAYILFTDNDNGVNINPTITECYAEGFSGTVDSSFPGALDGFIFGNPSGAVIALNTMKNFSQEAIFIQPNTFTTNRPTFIINNTIQYDLSAGSGYYGIRCDASNIDISNNTIINENYGILCRGAEATDPYKQKFTNLRISNNDINISPNATLAQRAVYIQGNTTGKTDNFIVSNNHITLSGVTLTNTINLITIADCEKSIIDKNTVSITGTTGMDATHQLNIYALLNSNDSVVFGSLDISGSYSNLFTYGTGSNTNITSLNPTKGNVLFKNASYTVLATDFSIQETSSLVIFADATPAGLTITPPVGAAFAGYKIAVIKTDSTSNVVTVANVTGTNTLTAQGRLDFVFNATTNTWWTI
ncbi:glycosyl hydrolase family 28-related protein [Mucilaginibacter rubeus]|uniref:Pectate lyase superfamily protein domain-containing protein n=1 Tax=Mucilaginibacter rubeus TaxID=2027860 RepID=A0A5C1I459_9SPHI|nr:glycosyl hydrolase family 28-related protein [Mucilaginibacter rubeus]QEM12168.1 hypothetical protein DEO27_019770 [Mucilaginibacter rubeus]